MELMAMGIAPPSSSRTNAGSWAGRLRRLWMTTRRDPHPGYVLDGLTLRHRRPLADLHEAMHGDFGGVALMLDHEHPGSMGTLRAVQAALAQRIDADPMVVGIENLPAGQAEALRSYRSAVLVPVFAVDLARPGDRLLLQEALVAARVAAALYHDPGAAPRVPSRGTDTPARR